MPAGYEPDTDDRRKIAFQRKYNYQRLVTAAQKHFEEKRFEAAAQAYDAASQIEVGEPGPIFNRAISLQMLGRVDEALANYQRVRFGPRRLEVCLNLATLRPSLLTEGEVSTMEAAAASPATDREFRTKLYFGLGYLRDHQGRFDEAFAAFAEGNRLKAASLDLAGAETHDIETMARNRRDFTAASLARWSGQGHPSGAPIFVVGLPRSGTTLIEQILATHPDVQGMGETTALSEAIDGRLHWPPPDDVLSDHFRQIGGDYIRAIRRQGWDGAKRFVDKLPTNYLLIGVIALTFPRATILHSVRDPMDTCLSYYRHVFETANEPSYDLAALGRAYRRYREMMDYWSEVLPGRVIDVRHEEMVADPEGRIRWLVSDACGLPWRDACLRFHENDRFVNTESKFQVRQPIFDTSIGRWKNYQQHLGPLIEALGPYAAGSVAG